MLTHLRVGLLCFGGSTTLLNGLVILAVPGIGPTQYVMLGIGVGCLVLAALTWTIRAWR